jgi:hypothetical protein
VANPDTDAESETSDTDWGKIGAIAGIIGVVATIAGILIAHIEYSDG